MSDYKVLPWAEYQPPTSYRVYRNGVGVATCVVEADAERIARALRLLDEQEANDPYQAVKHRAFHVWGINANDAARAFPDCTVWKAWPAPS